MDDDMNEEREQNELIKKTVDCYFGEIADSRRVTSCAYKLVDIIFITICAVLSGANDIKSISQFAKAKSDWLTSFLGLSGIPCYNTFWMVFAFLKPESFQSCFIKWAQAAAGVAVGENIAIDGKALRATAKAGHPNSFVHIVSAWAANSNLTLGQFKVDGKSNEITAIPELLATLDIKDAVITIDAIGCQTKIVSAIADGGGDYIVAVKKNQQNLFDEIENYFNQVDDNELQEAKCEVFESNNDEEKAKHGRIEKRKVYTTEAIDFLLQKEEWKNFKSITCVVSQRTIKETTAQKIEKVEKEKAASEKMVTKPKDARNYDSKNDPKENDEMFLPPKATEREERRYYISSLPANPKLQGSHIRSHWGIENKVHWMLDVGFNEDRLKAKGGNIAPNLAVIRHMALNCLKQEKTIKAGIANKRLQAAWNPAYLLKVLGNLIVG